MKQQRRRDDENKIINLANRAMEASKQMGESMTHISAPMRSIQRKNDTAKIDLIDIPSIEQFPELYHTCPKHGVITPYYTRLLQRWIKRTCPCMREEREAREAKEIARAWGVNQRVICYGGWLGKDFEDRDIANTMSQKTFDTYTCEPDDEVYRAVYEYAHQDRLRGNLALVGNYGTGKTHLGAAVLNYRREEMGEKTLCASAPQLFAAWEEYKRLPDQTHFTSIRHRMISADELYLDDIDKEWRGENRQPELWSIYYYIFDERYKARRPTIVSTNELEHLARYIGPAAKSRLMSKCLTLQMLGEDYR